MVYLFVWIAFKSMKVSKNKTKKNHSNKRECTNANWIFLSRRKQLSKLLNVEWLNERCV